jgi:hypothetical protein
MALLPTDIAVPLVPSKTDAVPSQPEEHPWLPLFRLFLAFYRNAGPASHVYSIPDDIAKKIETEFADQRRRAAASEGKEALMTDMELLQLLGLARLLALSCGRDCLDSITWERMKTMESARQARIQKNAVQAPGH